MIKFNKILVLGKNGKRDCFWNTKIDFYSQNKKAFIFNTGGGKLNQMQILELIQNNYLITNHVRQRRSQQCPTSHWASQPQGQEPSTIFLTQDGEEVFFKIKSTTQLKKLMDAYCQRQGLSANNVRFLFDGERLHETQTPRELNMENGDEIDVLVEQVGGSHLWCYVLIPILLCNLGLCFLFNQV